MQTIVVLSGKGGVGKTSFALSVCVVLASLEHKVLLVDADLGTHGASYFLKVHERNIGLDEFARRLSTKGSDQTEIAKDFARFGIITAEGIDNKQYKFDFTASTTRFLEDYTKPEVSDSRGLLQRIDLYCKQNKFEYLIYDCQSGVNEFTFAILAFTQTVSQTSAVIVAEADTVSAKSIKTLESQFAKVLPPRTKYLIDKLYLKEATSYQVLTSLIKTFGYLPPLSFDFGVREGFALGTIPIDLDRPTPYLYAILRVMKELIPESRAEFEATGSQLRESAIGSYRARLGELQSEQIGVETEITKLQVGLATRRQRMNQRLVTLLSAALVLIGGVIAFRDSILAPYLFNFNVVLGIVIALSGLSIPVIYYYRRFEAETESSAETIEELGRKLTEVKNEIEKYTTLVVTESEDSLAMPK